MADQTTTSLHPTLVALDSLAHASQVPGPAWTHQSDDLNVNLLVFGAGDGVAEHVNAEVDVLVVGISGNGLIIIDGHDHACVPGGAVVIPKGARRGTRATSDQFAYLTCHRRRAGLWPTVRPRPRP